MKKYLFLCFDDGGLMVDWSVWESDPSDPDHSVGCEAFRLLSNNRDFACIEVYADGDRFSSLNGELRVAILRR